MKHSLTLCGPEVLCCDVTSGDKVTTVIRQFCFSTFKLFECCDLSCYFEEMRRHSLVPAPARVRVRVRACACVCVCVCVCVCESI